MKIRHASACLTGVIAVALTTWATAQEIAIRLSDLTREDEVAMQRGYSVGTVACAADIIREIRGYGGAEAMAEFELTFGGSQILISNGMLMHICDKGVQLWVDKTSILVIQIFDEVGQPTLMEF